MATSSAKRPDMVNAPATVRYQVKDVERSIAFYSERLGFALEQKTGPFAAVTRGNLRLILSGPGTSGARPLPDGRQQEPGGWNRILLYVDDLKAEIARLSPQGVSFINEVEVGPGAHRS